MGCERPVEADEWNRGWLEVAVVDDCWIGAFLADGDRRVDSLFPDCPRSGSHRASCPSVRIRHLQRGHQE